MSQYNQDPSKKYGIVMFIIAWIFILFLFYLYADYWYTEQNYPNQNIETIVGSAGHKEVHLKIGRDHAYHFNGLINDRPVTFMIDTGATSVSIPAKLATNMNLKKGMTVRIQTAAGMIYGYLTKLDSLTIGKITLHDIEAVISPYSTSKTVLLGMSALKHLEFEHKNGVLILRQR